ncbi:hypothetical protein X727_02630 [Mesorhizobium sp. L103C119B0]|uniref:hypothetical protein n=1 Tax=unclassified Mesorhizobium TaxID=325217 RepID=UPI0003D00BE4|nr:MULTISPECIES: hypothetical protein [unclassified Mesorhizobium]ESZ73735.1 hypothetical protein X727_02630 [Mesorhizobium sp. L103C119B0]WJI65403.1 hypothetical protein NLY43_11975 [Mesorhizobium sp. C416B]
MGDVSRLVRQGRTVLDIAVTFGTTDLKVKRILALGDLLPKIREAYRREEIDTEPVRHLTMSSKAQQKDWLALCADPDQYAPRGYQLKQWLFGGQSISTKVALFAIEEYPGLITSDLFGEDSYFADADLFWQKQNEAIATKRDTYLNEGWSEVVRWNRASISTHGTTRRPRRRRAARSSSLSRIAARSSVTRAGCHARKPAAPARAASKKKQPPSCRAPKSPARCTTISICIAMPPCARPCSTIPPWRCASWWRTPSPVRACGRCGLSRSAQPTRR